MFEYCRARHDDPSYQFFGTVDYGILDTDSRTLLMYSMVNMGGQWIQLHVVPPFRFEEFVASNAFKGENLQQVFRAANLQQKVGVKIKCMRVERDHLLPIIMKDAASLSPEDQASLESVIGEVF